MLRGDEAHTPQPREARRCNYLPSPGALEPGCHNQRSLHATSKTQHGQKRAPLGEWKGRAPHWEKTRAVTQLIKAWCSKAVNNV